VTMMQITATVDMRNLERRLSVLRTKEIPSAIRNTLNDMAFDLRGRMVKEIQKIFDRPVPLVQSLPRVKKGDNKTFQTELYLTDLYTGKRKRGPSYALLPHMTGEPDTRRRKGLEYRLEKMGRIKPTEWMMPTHYAPLDAFGNVPGPQVSRMIADIGAYNLWSGDAANTKLANLAKRKHGAGQYFWVGRSTRTAAGVRGIFKRVGKQIIPMFVVVSKTPRYTKRFRWNEIAKLYTAKRIQYHAQHAIAQAISKRG